MFGWFKKKPETRAGGNFTAQVMAARAAYITGTSGMAELTATVASCVTLWESAFALADVEGAPGLDRRTMAMVARACALRGETVLLILPDGSLHQAGARLT